MNGISRLTKSNGAKLGFFKFLMMGVVLLVNGHFAKAQNLASINGKVQDPSGAAIPDTAVTVTSAETGTTRAVTSDDQGDYRVLSLPVGAYEIKAEKAGFKTRLQSGIQLVVGQQAVVNLVLEVGQVQQQVTVTADVQVVNTSTVSTAGLVEEEQVKDLPLNGRSFDNLITLNAGAANVTSEKSGGAGAQNGNMFAVSGRRWSENEYLINGVEYPGPQDAHSEPGGVSGQLLGVDAVREFNVLEEAYDAEYGKRAGGQINIVTMSGTNQLHGSVFEFIRNSDLDARNFFDHPQGERIPPFKRNQFGGTLGGPIKKDKTFVFGNYEGFRQRLGVSDVDFVPDANARQGILPCGVITPLPSGCPSTTSTTPMTVPNLNPGMLPYANLLWPVPNGPELLTNGIASGIAESFENPLEKIREDFGTVRADQIFSTEDTLGASFLFDDGHALVPQSDPNFGTDTFVRSQVLSLQETHIFSPNLINIATFGFSRVGWTYFTPALVDIPPNLLFVTGQPLGRVTIGATGSANSATITAAGGGKGTNVLNKTDRFTYADAIQVVRGRHQFSAGIWLQPLDSSEYFPQDAGGLATFTSLQTLLTGISSSFQAAPTTTTMYWKQLEGAWFVQDTIQVRRNLTIRLGLRHEFTNGWDETHGQASQFVYGSNGILQTAPVVGSNPFTVNNTKWLFGPRVGIAWDPFGKGKTSIRAGFGTHYDIQDTLGSAALDTNPPFNGITSFSNVSILSLIPINPSTPVAPQCGPGVPTPCTTYAVAGYPTNLKTPTVEEYSLTVQQQITPNTSLTVGYVGAHGFHGLLDIAPNAIPPQICSNVAGCTAGGNSTTNPKPVVPEGTLYIPVGTLPNPYLANGGNYLASENNTAYNAMEVGLAHRYSFGLQFRANYTWSKSQDISTGYSSDDTTTTSWVMEPYNPKADWGPSGDNKKNKFVFSSSYALPFGSGKRWLNGLGGAGNKVVSGWQLNAIVTATSGFSFEQDIGSNRSGDGDSTAPDRPSWNPAFTGPVITGNPNQYFNPNAFTLPTLGTYGNVGRDVLYGPSLVDWDMSLFKTTTITERVKMEFRAEGFNILNHANFLTPGLLVFSGTAISPTAGVISGTATTSRQLQFGVKLLF